MANANPEEEISVVVKTNNGDLTLNPNNYCEEIKKLNQRDRKKIRQEDLLNLIINSPERPEIVATQDVRLDELITKFHMLEAKIANNTVDIVTLKESNSALTDENAALKESLQETKMLSNENNDRIDAIDQYTRVNNLEFVGLEPQEGKSDKEVVIDCILNLDPDSTIESDDIDYCHPLPSNRRDEKKVFVAKFLHRYSKIDILEKKKLKKNFKHLGKDVYINEHLSPANRKLFAAAAAKRGELRWKHLWTKNGVVFMRKTDESDIVKITNEKKLNSLL